MRIAIVNDMIMAVETLRRILMIIPECELAWISHNGADAVAKCAKDIPDLILMDLIMPVMDGVEATRQIMKNSPCAILVVTASVQQNTSKVFAAMGYGALDAVSTPVLGVNGNPESAQVLLTKITTIRKLIGKSISTTKSKTVLQNSQSRLSAMATPTTGIASSHPNLVVIGSSTGGPNALAAILSRLSANFGSAIAIVQHVDAQFTPGLVEWLNNMTPLTVKLATPGSRLEVGKVLIAGTNDHLKLQADLSLDYTKEPIDYPYRPSVDVFFKSVAQYWYGKGIGVLLTGMGKDGAEGLSILRQKGWHTIAQNQQSCVVYGMPKAAVDLDAAIEILPIEAIASTLNLLQK
jgi:two-component system response regulator WspF